MVKYLCLFLMILFSTQLHAQSLFEEAISGDTQASNSFGDVTYELSGYLRGLFYIGESAEGDRPDIKSSYAESLLKLRASHKSFGDGFAEIRFRRGYEFDDRLSPVDLREAYVNAYIGMFDFRIGHQIVVWGRADGINPTDNITPKNLLARSPDEDDRRNGNFLLRSFLNFHPLRMEAVWIPIYSASALGTAIVSPPTGVILAQPEYPGSELKDSGFALRMNVELPSLDGSVSYFNGYNPSPGIDLAISDTIEVIPKAYRLHVIGADFSMIMASIVGFRGEFAYRKPYEDYIENIYIPNPDFQYVIGGDREFGDLSFLVQYIGRYVVDFSDIPPPENALDTLNNELARQNRMYSYQQEEISHSISFRAGWKLLHENLELEVSGLYNFSTKEFLLRPKAIYRIADALTLTSGLERYSGSADTLFSMLDPHLSSIYFELKSSF